MGQQSPLLLPLRKETTGKESQEMMKVRSYRRSIRLGQWSHLWVRKQANLQSSNIFKKGWSKKYIDIPISSFNFLETAAFLSCRKK